MIRLAISPRLAMRTLEKRSIYGKKQVIFFFNRLCFLTKSSSETRNKKEKEGEKKKKRKEIRGKKKRKEKHLGAEEACGAHNPEVRRSKLRDAIFFSDGTNKTSTWIS